MSTHAWCVKVSYVIAHTLRINAPGDRRGVRSRKLILKLAHRLMRPAMIQYLIAVRHEVNIHPNKR